MYGHFVDGAEAKPNGVSKQVAHQKRRQARGMCSKEGCPNRAKAPGGWRCEAHAVEHAAAQKSRREAGGDRLLAAELQRDRVRRAVAAAARPPEHKPCACGAEPYVPSYCHYYKSGQHWFAPVAT